MGSLEDASGKEDDDSDNDKFHTGNFKDIGVWKKSTDFHLQEAWVLT